MADNNTTYYISKINLAGDPNTYYIKDQWARDQIATIGEYKHYLGVTTTALVDNVTTNPVVSIGGTNVTANVGAIVSVRSTGIPDKEFVYAPKIDPQSSDPGIWQAMGSSSDLGQMAFVDKGTVTIQPKGTVSQPTFTGTQGSVSVSKTVSASNIKVQEASSETPSGNAGYTPAGSVTSTYSNSNSEKTLTSTGTFTPSGTVSYSETTGSSSVSSSGSFTPSGSVSSSFTGTAATISVSHSSKTIEVTGTTTVPSGKTGYTPEGSVSYGSSSSSKTLSSTASYTPAGSVSASFSGTSGSVSVTNSAAVTAEVAVATSARTGNSGYTPSGSVSYTTTASDKTLTSTGTCTPQGTFSGSLTGTAATISVKNSAAYTVDVTGNTTVPSGKTAYKPAGTVSKPNVNVTPSTDSFCKTATVDTSTETLTITFGNAMTGASAALASTPTFTGTDVYLSGSIAANGLTSTGSYTPAGTVSGDITGSSTSVSVTGTLPTLSFSGTKRWLYTSVAKDGITSTGSFTPSGSVSGSFSGTAATITSSGTLPTLSFSGTKSYLTGSTGSVTSTGSYTPEGSVSSSFSGSSDTVSVSGALPNITYTPSQGNISVTGTLPAITSSFSGTKKYLYVSAYAGGTITSTGNFTPAGTVSQPTFSGTTETYDVNPKTST